MHPVNIYSFIFILIQAMWKQLYKSALGREKATLFQLKILLNNAATLDPVKNLHACEVLHAHVVAVGNHLS